MNYFNQVVTVTRWEFSRFFKPKNELMGILIMVVVATVFFFATRYAFSESDEKMEISVIADTDGALTDFLSQHYIINEVAVDDKTQLINSLNSEDDTILLEAGADNFVVHAYKSTSDVEKLNDHLTEYYQQQEMKRIGLTPDNLVAIMSPAPVVESYVYVKESGRRLLVVYFFAGLMIMAVFLSFAYQFTAITGEKQLKITEQIISAISPQVWMDGKIFGITLTGLSSMLTYSILSIVAGIIYFQFTGLPISVISDYVDLSAIALYLPFALVGILIWNAVLATIASIITDPNNSGKSGLMMVPILFVMASFLVIRDPDSGLSLFLSWFPFTSATAMPMRWAMTEVGFMEVAGSFIVLVLTFYFLRKLAAKIFRVSILITGKEPSFGEVFRMAQIQ